MDQVAALLLITTFLVPSYLTIAQTPADAATVYEIEDIDGNLHDLTELTNESPVVLVFYRGFD